MQIVVVADIVMSLDNVVAVAALANGRYVLLGLGLIVSIPFVIAGSALVLALIERFPIVIWLGAAILGWVAGGLIATDPVVQRYLPAGAQLDAGFDVRALGTVWHLDLLKVAFGFFAALVVVLGGLLWRARHPDRPDPATHPKNQ
jgi:predicted tellurium resistance membrane protein TerC